MKQFFPSVTLTFALLVPVMTRAASQDVVQPKDLFACAKDLVLKPSNARLPGIDIRAFSLPLNKEPEAIVLPAQDIVEKGQSKPGIYVLTSRTVNCHQLPKASVDHTMDTEWKTWHITLAYSKTELPSGSQSVEINVGHSMDEHELIDSQIASTREPGTALKPKSCLDPDSALTKNLLSTLERLASAIPSAPSAANAHPSKAWQEKIVKAQESCRALHNAKLDVALEKKLASYEKMKAPAPRATTPRSVASGTAR